jgi:hypothetical protein
MSNSFKRSSCSVLKAAEGCLVNEIGRLAFDRVIEVVIVASVFRSV